jgi:hypothetical protein
MTSTTSETEIFQTLRSERRGKLAGRIALLAARVLCALILGCVAAAVTVDLLTSDVGSVPARGVMDAVQ